MTRVYTKIGDVFSVELDYGSKKYFQLIAYDKTQLNSDVIRAFKTVYPCGFKPNLLDIVNDDIDFYAHCVTKFGVKMRLWEKIGNIVEVGDFSKILFRDTSDYGVAKDEEIIKLSHNWYIWHINEEFTDVGNLEGENRKAEIGVIINPYSIVNRIKTGFYDFIYPQLE